MPLQVYCPHCRELIELTEQQPGGQSVCPRCGGVMSAPIMPGQREKKLGLAITSMVLGIVGLASCPFFGIAGIILGIIVLAKASSTPTVDRGKGMAIAGIVTGAVSLVMAPMIIAILLPSLARAREIAKRTVCAANVSAIAAALTVYREDHEGQYAPDLAALIHDNIIDPASLNCPAAESSPPHYTYVHLAGGKCTGREVVIYEDLANHGGQGGNVGFCDGSVRFLDSKEWREVLRAGGVLPPP